MIVAGRLEYQQMGFGAGIQKVAAAKGKNRFIMPFRHMGVAEAAYTKYGQVLFNVQRIQTTLPIATMAKGGLKYVKHGKTVFEHLNNGR